MDLLRLILLNTNPGITAAFALLIGVLFVLSVTGAIRETDETTALELTLINLRRAVVILMTICIPMGIGALYLYAYKVFGYDFARADDFMGLWFGEFKAAISELWWSFIILLVTPYFIRTLMLRWVRPAISNWMRKFRVKQTGDALSDIRIEVGKIKPKDFDPRTYYLPDQMFLGLNEFSEPIYVSDEIFRKNHTKVIGPSQTGKGVLLGVLLDQAIKKGWGVWFVDQKPDDFLYDIMRESCELNNRPTPSILDFNGIGPGAYAPFANGTRRERRERVVKAYSMKDSGTAADFYKRNERQVLDFLMPLWDGSLTHLEKLLRGKSPEISDTQRTWIAMNSGSINSNTSEFMQLDSLRATPEESFNVAEALATGAVVYVRSNMADTIVRKGCIALIDEVIQVALRKPSPQPIFIVLDEIKFIVSDTLADALATVLSKNLSMALTYQAITDLLNLPDKSLNAESIRGGIDTNTQQTISYRANDFETAEWVSLQTGSGQKSVTKLEKVDVNRGGAEEWGAERSVGQVEEQLITTNQLLSLPPRVSALIRPNQLSTLLYTCWITIKERKGMPLRDTGTPKPAVSAQIEKMDQVEDENPFDDQPGSEEFVDPFADSAPGEDVFNDDTSDPFEFSNENKSSAIPEQKPESSKLSAEEEAAVALAVTGILPNSTNKSKNSPDKTIAKQSVDLSAIDEIQGI
jgi:TraM recognition site of TraD and TraG